MSSQTPSGEPPLEPTPPPSEPVASEPDAETARVPVPDAAGPDPAEPAPSAPEPPRVPEETQPSTTRAAPASGGPHLSPARRTSGRRGRPVAERAARRLGGAGRPGRRPGHGRIGHRRDIHPARGVRRRPAPARFHRRGRQRGARPVRYRARRVDGTHRRGGPDRRRLPLLRRSLVERVPGDARDADAPASRSSGRRPPAPCPSTTGCCAGWR